MSLVHKFKIIEVDKHITYREVTSEGAVLIDDSLIQYIGDTIKWVNSHWNDFSNFSTGINYYGITFFEGSEISELELILENWKNMFEVAPDEFLLKTDYDLEEMIFIRENFSKMKVLKQLEDVLQLCVNARDTSKILVHFGI